jgi:hypothetical protein
VAERVTDPKKRELLAPKEPFHTFGALVLLPIRLSLF